MKALWLILGLSALGVGGILYAQGGLAPPLQPVATETFGDRVRRICAVEAGNSAKDRQDCYDRRIMAKSAETFSTDFNQKMRAAGAGR